MSTVSLLLIAATARFTLAGVMVWRRPPRRPRAQVTDNFQNAIHAGIVAPSSIVRDFVEEFGQKMRSKASGISIAAAALGPFPLSDVSVSKMTYWVK